MNASRPSCEVANSSSAIASSGGVHRDDPDRCEQRGVLLEGLRIEGVEARGRWHVEGRRLPAARNRGRRSDRGSRGRCPSPRRCAASNAGRSAVARSSVFRAGKPHQEMRIMPAPGICSGSKPRIAAAPPVVRSSAVTASSPACSFRMSRTTGRYSMAWPSESMTGWSRRDLIRRTSSLATNSIRRELYCGVQAAVMTDRSSAPAARRLGRVHRRLLHRAPTDLADAARHRGVGPRDQLAHRAARVRSRAHLPVAPRDQLRGSRPRGGPREPVRLARRAARLVVLGRGALGAPARGGTRIRGRVPGDPALRGADRA